MLVFFRLYNNKHLLLELHTISKFNNPNRPLEVRTGREKYPITANEGGICLKIDDYRVFIEGYPKVIHNVISDVKLNELKDLTFSQLQKSIEAILEYMIKPKDSKLSILTLGFNISTEIKGMDVIRGNILMNQYKNYNHDKNSTKFKEIKEFSRNDYSIKFSAEKRILKRLNFIKIEIEFKSDEFEGVTNIYDLNQKDAFRRLFSIFMKRFNQLTIVDKIQTFEMFEEEDKILMQKFMTIGYWDSLKDRAKRNNLSRDKKLFESLILKYNLNTTELYIKEQLNIAFQKFISN